MILNFLFRNSSRRKRETTHGHLDVQYILHWQHDNRTIEAIGKILSNANDKSESEQNATLALTDLIDGLQILKSEPVNVSTSV